MVLSGDNCIDCKSFYTKFECVKEALYVEQVRFFVQGDLRTLSLPWSTRSAFELDRQNPSNLQHEFYTVDTKTFPFCLSGWWNTWTLPLPTYTCVNLA
jgi:hypothetical protein